MILNARLRLERQISGNVPAGFYWRFQASIRFLCSVAEFNFGEIQGKGFGGETTTAARLNTGDEDVGEFDDVVFECLHNFKLDLADADEDPDKDGMTNIEEFRAGTDPNSTNSIFRVSGERSATGNAALSWQPAAGKTYRLMGTSSPDRPFEFLRFLTEEEASAGQLNLAPSGSFQFFVLEVE